ncbi:MAG: Haloacid dehalogenase domain protein hydrolase, partial [Frankiales bacterium]|nr:Haloacid dehalogenase domain protein hydrolase [Frankiales bacterium]
AYGTAVTPERLARVDRAEQALKGLLGPRDVRVRDLGDNHARVELDAEALARWTVAAASVVRAEGFTDVETKEFRSGSMNDLLQITPAR